MQALSAAYVTVGLRYIRIIVHKFPREKSRNMLYRIYPGFPPAQVHRGSLSEHRWGWQGQQGAPCAHLASYFGLSRYLLSVGQNLCARPEVSTRYIAYWHGREAFSIQVAITFHPCSPGDVARPELLLSREEMLWARGRAGLLTAVARGRDRLVFLHLLLCSFSPQ